MKTGRALFHRVLVTGCFLAAVPARAVPPDAPLVAINTYKQRVQVSWDRPAGAVSFNLYYAKAPDFDNWHGASMGNKTRAGIDLPVGVSYEVVMTAVNGNGEESDLSTPALFEVTEPGPAADTRNPVLYIATSDTDTDLFRDVGVSVTLETTDEAIYAYDLKAGTLEAVKTNSSPSYASSIIRPVGMDGRMFISHYWNGTEYFEFEEIGGDGSADYFTADALKGCFAVVGDSLFFSEHRAENLFGQPVGEGGFRELSLPDAHPGVHDAKGEIVFDEGEDDERCGYNMSSSGGIIYDAVWWDDSVISLVRRDPDTLAREEYFFDFTESDAGSDYEVRPLFSFYDGKGYFVRSTDAGAMQIWEYVFGSGAAGMIYVIDDPRFTAAPLIMDAEGDYLVLGNNDGIALMIDRRKGITTWIDIGSYYDLELLVR